MLRKLLAPSGFKLGLVITLVFCLWKVSMLVPRFANGTFGTFFSKLENIWTDMKMRIQQSDLNKAKFQESAHSVIVAIDEKSLRMPDLGMWPWPRVKVAEMVSRLIQCGVKVVGFDVVFAEPDSARAAPVVNRILEEYARRPSADQSFSRELAAISEQVDGDKVFAKLLEDATNVVLGYFFFTSPDQIAKLDSREIKEGQERIGYGTITHTVRYPQTDLERVFPHALGVRANLSILTEAAELYGFFNVIPDSDGVYRHIPMVFAFRTGVGEAGEKPIPDLFPSLSLQLLSSYYGLPVHLYVHTIDGTQDLEGSVGLVIAPMGSGEGPHIEIPVEKEQHNGLFRVKFYGEPMTFRHVSAGDIIHGEPEACEAVRGKIVLIGSTAIGVYDLRPTPFGAEYPGVEIHASAIENIIRGDYLIRSLDMPVWELFFILIVGVLFSWLLNRFHFTFGAMMTLLVLALLLGLDYLLLFRGGILAQPVLPMIQQVVMLIGIAIFRYVTEEREKSKTRRAFQFYLSKDVIDEIMRDTTKLSLGGERRELTVLFSDIRGFTTISEAMAPAELMNFLNKYFTPMTDIVFKHHGTLDKYMGDAVMAFFGAPVPFADHPQAACRCALDMIRELAVLRESWKAQGLPELDIGVGINTGPMSVGNMGSKDRFGYTVIGDNVNLGSRLEGLNKQYGTHIIISEFTHALVKDQFTCRELGSVRVKGKNKPVLIYELLHAGPPEPTEVTWFAEFHQALEAYRSAQFDLAITLFGRYPDDGPSQKYIKSCHDKKNNPPGPDWDGVLQMTTK